MANENVQSSAPAEPVVFRIEWFDGGAIVRVTADRYRLTGDRPRTLSFFLEGKLVNMVPNAEQIRMVTVERNK